MLAVLLDSFADMDLPDADVSFIIVENEAQTTIDAQVAAFADRVGLPVVLEAEPRPGIPAARNRVLDLALDGGYDFLTFVDDDERVAPDWLVRLTAGIEARNLDLVGGPLELEVIESDVPPVPRAVFKQRVKTRRKKDQERAERAAQCTDGDLHIYTNNWCLRLASARATGVRFDEALSVSGGSDTMFSIALRRAGARTGWVPDALVYDRLPTRRLTLRYAYRRSRDQTLTTMRALHRSRFTAMKRALGDGRRGIFTCIAALWRGEDALASAALEFGRAAGRLKWVYRGRSRHYAETARADHEG